MSNRSDDFRSLSTPTRGLAGLVQRATRSSGRHPKTAIALWLVLIVGLVAGGSLVGMRELSPLEAGVGESGDAERVLADAGMREAATESVLVSAADPSTAESDAADLAGKLEELPAVAGVTNPAAAQAR